MHHFGTVRRHLDQLLWALLPGVCILCDANSRTAADLCEHCREALPRLVSAVSELRAASLEREPIRIATHVDRTHRPIRERSRRCDTHEPVTRMIHRLKFRGSRIDARVLGRPARVGDRRCICRQPLPDLIVPVPLSRRRLCDAVTTRRRCSLDGSTRRSILTACERVRDTPPQAGLSRTRRLHNLTDAFATDRRFDDLCVAVVDDVMTTGSTVAVAVSNAARRRREGSSRVGRRENAASRRANPTLLE